MKSAPYPDDELRRLEAVHHFDLLDTLPEAEFDDLTQLASHICGTPIALMTILDTERQWFKSRVGIDATETPRAISFCGHAILGDTLFEVEDALADERFADNPLVTGAPDIRFYAGAPLASEKGHRLGTLCVIDTVPRQLSQTQRDALMALGRQVSRQIENRARIREMRSNQLFLKTLIDALPVAIFSKHMQGPRAGEIVIWNRACETISGYAADDVIGHTNDQFLPPDQAALYDAHDRTLASKRASIEIPFHEVKALDGSVRYVRTTSIPLFDQAGAVDFMLGISEDITNTTLQTFELKKKQAQLLGVSDASPLGLFRTDTQNAFTYINRKYEVITGLSAAGAAGMGWLAGLHPDDRSRVLGACAQAASRQAEYTNFQRFIRPDGSTVLCKVMAAPIVVDGQFTGFVGTIDDITDRRRVSDALAESQARLRLVTDNLPALIGYIDARQRYRFANSSYRTLLGFDPDAMLGRSVADVHGPVAYARMAPEIEAALSGERISVERRSGSGDGSVYFQCEYVPDIDDRGVVAGFYAMAVDVTARRVAEQKLADSERRLAAITDNLPVLITYIDSQRRFKFANATIEAWMGVTADAVQDRLFEDVNPAIAEERREYVDRALAGERVEFEICSEAAGMKRFLHSVYIPDVASDGMVNGFYTITSDVSKIKESEQRLAVMARFDHLTSLPNRFQLQEKMLEASARAKRSKTSMAVMYLDIDRFKAINDEYGHATGDAVLIEFGRRLKAAVRETDTVARLAGDEFVIVLEGLQNASEPKLVATKIIEAMATAHAIGKIKLQVSTSIGIAYAHTNNMTPDELLALADKSLYQAKKAGRNNFQIS